jgi:hypothetical protein
LERINDAIKVLMKEQKVLSRHLARQKSQPAWDEEGNYKPNLKNKE